MVSYRYLSGWWRQIDIGMVYGIISVLIWFMVSDRYWCGLWCQIDIDVVYGVRLTLIWFMVLGRYWCGLWYRVSTDAAHINHTPPVNSDTWSMKYYLYCVCDELGIKTVTTMSYGALNSYWLRLEEGRFVHRKVITSNPRVKSSTNM